MRIAQLLFAVVLISTLPMAIATTIDVMPPTELKIINSADVTCASGYGCQQPNTFNMSCAFAGGENATTLCTILDFYDSLYIQQADITCTRVNGTLTSCTGQIVAESLNRDLGMVSAAAFLLIVVVLAVVMVFMLRRPVLL